MTTLLETMDEIGFSYQLQIIEQVLASLISKQNLSPLLAESTRYSLLAPGKRLRPLLTLATVQAWYGNIEQALLPAAALEMVHAYSLIHDDLPCMDDDDWRRGKPSLHRAFPEGHAVLTGDYLLTYAFELLSSSPHLTSDQKVSLIQLLARRIGGEGMIGGQVIDLSSEGKEIDWPTLEKMYRDKTAALISCALEFGAIIAEVSPKDREQLKLFGIYLGLAFQIQDDLHEDKTPESSDQKKKKATAVALLGYEGARVYASTLYASAEKALDSLSRPTPLLTYLLHKLISR